MSSKPAIAASDYDALLRQTQLKDVWLTRAVVERGKETADAGVRVPVRVRRRLNLSWDDGCLFAEFSVRVETGKQDAPLFRINAAFVLAYECASEPPEGFKGPFERNVVAHAWPYVREFVASTTTRMGLPGLTLPPIHFSMPGDPPMKPAQSEIVRSAGNPEIDL